MSRIVFFAVEPIVFLSVEWRVFFSAVESILVLNFLLVEASSFPVERDLVGVPVQNFLLSLWYSLTLSGGSSLLMKSLCHDQQLLTLTGHLYTYNPKGKLFYLIMMHWSLQGAALVLFLLLVDLAHNGVDLHPQQLHQFQFSAVVQIVFLCEVSS